MKVLVATDGSESSYEAIRGFIRITHGMRHEIGILYVMPSTTLGRMPGYLLLEQEREGATALNTAKSLFDDVAIPVKTEMRQGRPPDAILEAVREGGYELLVIGRRGRSEFRERLFGSVGRAVVRSAPCALLIGK